MMKSVEIRFIVIIAWVLVATLPVISKDLMNPKASIFCEKSLLNGETIVNLKDLDNKVIHVKASIYIDSLPMDVWNVITDYENIAEFLPQVLESKFIEDNGRQKLISQTGITDVFSFKKVSKMTLSVEEKYLMEFFFQQAKGEFKIYQGSFELKYNEKTQGTFLTYQVELKPKFYIPGFVLRHVLKKDAPEMLQAIRKRTETVVEHKISKQ